MKIVILTLWYAEHTILLANGFSLYSDVIIYTAVNSVFEGLKGKINSSVGVKIFDKPNGTYLQRKQKYELLVDEIKSLKPDIIMIQDGNFLLSKVINSFKGLKAVSIHDPIPHRGEHKKIFKLINNYSMIKKSDVVVTHCMQDAKNICLYYRCKMDKVLVSTLGVHNIYKTSYKYDEKKQILIFGRMQRYKGLKTFIDAAMILEPKLNDYTFVVAGRGDDVEKYRDDISGRLNILLIDKYISNEDVDRLFQESQIVVLPYASATQSGVLFTAMAYNKRIVASDVGGLSEVIKKYPKLGVLVPRRSAEKLAEGILEVINNFENYSYEETYIEEYYYEFICKNLIEKYGEIIGP